ncbi:MAG: hypothetical protein GX488_06175 [Clostridiales bacterium]|nr:hypothetical protein [Clostridiales bacterium]
MNNSKISNGIFDRYIFMATDSLRIGDLKRAYEIIIEAMQVDPDAPQPHNLLGIWFELHGNTNMARRHYRAAYALDPTYRPACKNLERICTMTEDVHMFCFGDETD